MTNILKFFLFLNVLCYFYLFIAVYYNFRINIFGIIFIGLSTFFILLIFYNRSLSKDTTLVFFLFLYSLSVGMDLLDKKTTFLKKTRKRVIDSLDVLFFNFLFINKGVFYLSRVFFRKLDRFMVPYQINPLNLLSKVVICPWLIFIFSLNLEFYFSEKIYLSAIFFCLTLILNCLLLVSLRILEYSCLESLVLIDIKLFSSSNRYSLPVLFQKFSIYKQEKNKGNETTRFYLNSGRNFSSTYFCSKILKNTFFQTIIFLNRITFLVILLLVLLKYQSMFFFLSDFLFLNVLAIFHFILKFDFNFSSWSEIIYHQKRLLDFVSTFRINTTLVFYPKNPKPKDILDFFLNDNIWELSYRKKRFFSFSWVVVWVFSFYKIILIFFFFSVLIWLSLFYFSNIEFLIFNYNFSFFSWSFLLKIYGIFDTFLDFVFLPPILEKLITFFLKI